MYEKIKTPSCLPINNPNKIPNGTLFNKEPKVKPYRDTPALAKANNGIIPKAT